MVAFGGGGTGGGGGYSGGGWQAGGGSYITPNAYARYLYLGEKGINRNTDGNWMHD